ncbi:MFS transporter [Jatrophihabitans sp. DSM 45814]
MVSSQADRISAANAELRRSRLGASLAFGAQGLLFAVLLTHVPQFKSAFDVGDGGITIVILVVSIIAGAGSIGAEAVAARFGSKLSLQLGLIWIGLAALAIAASSTSALGPSRVLFFGGFVVYGFGLGAVDAGTNMQAVAIQFRYGRSILTSFHACWSAGGIIGALYVAGTERLQVSLGTSIAIAALVVTALGLLAGRILLQSDPGPATTTGGSQNPSPAVSVPWRPILLLGAAMVCFYVTDAGAGSWATTYAHDVLKASSSLAPVAFAAYQSTALVSRMAGDQVVRRIGIEPTVRIGAVVGAAGLLVAICAPSPWIAIVGFAIVGCGLPVVAPLCFSACGTLAQGQPDAVVATVVARVNIFNYVGSIIGGVAVGGIGTATSLRYGFIVPVILALALLFLAPAFDPKPITQAKAAVR